MKKKIILLCLVLLLPVQLLAACFTSLELKAITPPDFCQNAIAYKISYFDTIDGNKMEVYPSQAAREKDADLILAKVVWAILEDEYYADEKGLDEWWVESTTPGMIDHLVSHDFLQKSWKADNRKQLKRYMASKAPYTQLYLMNAILDYQDVAGCHCGTDMNPILLQFTPHNVGVDKALVLFVSVSEEYPVPPEKLP